MSQLSFFDQIDDRIATANRAEKTYRDRIEDRIERNRIDSKSYNAGRSVGLNEARALAERELRRLCNKFQNGSLTVADFNVVL